MTMQDGSGGAPRGAPGTPGGGAPAGGSRPGQEPDRQPSGRLTSSGILVGRPFGIPVYISPTWLLLAVLITYTFGPYVGSQLPGLGNAKWIVSFAYAVFLLFSVLVHELAHSVVAARLGLKVRQITLWLLGGMSSLDEPDTPGREFLVAAAGPAASILVAALSFGAYTALPEGTVLHLVAGQLAFVNALLAVFNLLPGLPLDGGSIVRSVVWKVSGRRSTGTVGAAWSGRVIAILVLFASVWLAFLSGGGNFVDILWGGLIALFLWQGASQTLRVQQVRNRLPRAQTRALLRPATTVPGDLPLGEAIRRAREAGRRALVVVDSAGRPTGIVSEAAVVATPEARWPWMSVSALTSTLEEGSTITADLDGEALVEALNRRPSAEYLVVEPGTGEVAGVLTMADVERALTPV